MPKEIGIHEIKNLNILPFLKKEIDLALSKGMTCHFKSQNKNEGKNIEHTWASKEDKAWLYRKCSL